MTRIEVSEDLSVQFGQTVQSQTAVQGLDLLVQARSGQAFYDSEGNLISEHVGDLLTQTEYAPDPSLTETLQITLWDTVARASGQPLDGATAVGDEFVSVTTDDYGQEPAGVTQVVFAVNGVTVQTENSAPWELAGGPPYDFSALGEGVNTVTATVTRDAGDGGDVVLSASVFVAPVVDDGTTVVGDLAATPQDSAAQLSWTAPTASLTVAAYRIYQDGTWIGDVTEDGFVAAPDEESPAGSEATTFITDEQLAAVRSRTGGTAVGGSLYVSDGDTFSNSPDDWERIVARKNAFMSNPDAGRWAPSYAGAIPDRGYAPDVALAGRLVNAALYSLIADDDAVAEAVIDELVAQAQESGADFSDRTKFPYSYLQSNYYGTTYHIGNWGLVVWHAYDLVKARMSASQVTTVQGWLWALGDWYRQFDDVLDGYYGADRDTATPTLTRGDGDVAGKVLYYGGPVSIRHARTYGAGEAAYASLMAMVGWDTDDADMKLAASRFFKEFFMYGAYAEGAFSNFHRWEDNNSGEGHEAGYQYTCTALLLLTNIAEIFARNGDTSLYDFTTTWGTQYGGSVDDTGDGSTAKGLEWAWERIADYTGGVYTRYATDQAGNLNVDHLLDSVSEPTSWFGWTDVGACRANRYYNNARIKQLYKRTGAMKPVPPTPASGVAEASEDAWGVHPGVLLCYGDLEDVVTDAY